MSDALLCQDGSTQCDLPKPVKCEAVTCSLVQPTIDKTSVKFTGGLLQSRNLLVTNNLELLLQKILIVLVLRALMSRSLTIKPVCGRFSSKMKLIYMNLTNVRKRMNPNPGAL